MPTLAMDWIKAFLEDLFKDISSIPTKKGRSVAYFFATLIAAAYIAIIILSFFKPAWSVLLVLPYVGHFILRFVLRKDKDNAAPLNRGLLAGASPIGVAQGALVKSLGRQVEIGQLTNWVTGGEVAAILVWGVAAVGKTSLVSAGLRSELASSAPDFKFFNADASEEFEEGLAQQLREEGENIPRSLNQIIVSNRKRKQVIVLDNASLARGDRIKKVVDLIKLAVAQNGPYKRVFIVIVDDVEFRSIWQKEGWEPRSRVNGLKKLPVDKFSDVQALEVMQSLKREASIPVDDEALSLGMQDLAQANPSSGQLEVSPLSLSIFISLVARETGNGAEFGVGEYFTCGRAHGLMAAFLANELFRFAPNFWKEISSRIAAESQSSGAFSKAIFADLPGGASVEVEAVLEGLSSPELRVLRVASGTDKYRVTDAWAPVVQAMSAGRDADVVAAEDFLKARFLEWRRWSNTATRGGRNVIRRKYGNARYLLSRGELRTVNRFQGRLSLVGSIGEYIALSKRYRGGWLVAVSVLLVGLVPATYAASRMIVQWRQVDAQGNWGVPIDFSKYDNQIKQVSLVSGCMVRELAWLPRGLERLDAACGRIKNLEGIPPSLTQLSVSATAISNLKRLPKSVRDLDISSTSIGGDVALADLNLRSLNVSGLRLVNVRLLPATLTSLVLGHPDIDSIEGLPENLQTLELIGSSVRSLRGLPPRLRALKLRGNNALPAIDYLPPHLNSLDTDRGMEPGKQLPESLRILHLRVITLPKIPESITSLELSGGASVEGELPKGLERLWINSTMPVATLEELPAGLKSLKLVWPPGARFEGLPQGLSVLDLSWSTSVSSAAGLRAPLSALTLTQTKVKTFRNLPASITSLTDQFCEMNEVKEFPPRLQELDLSGCEYLELVDNLPGTLEELNVGLTAVSTLPELPKQLRKLNISNTRIKGSLPKLPDHLEELTVHFGQFDTFKGLPASVKRIIFVRDERKLVLEEE